MRNRFILLAGLISCLLILSFSTHKKQPRVLVFSKTSGFHHNSIPDGIAAISKIGKEQGFAVDTTTDSSFFRNDVLKKYAAVIFLNTTGNVLGSEQEKAFRDYIRKGGGYVGVHAASDTEYGWEWYGKLTGAYFSNHPKPQTATLNIVNANHLATRNLPSKWMRMDEWYNFKNLSQEINVLLTIDETSYKGGKNGAFHPMAWCHEFEGGRAFYTALGHTSESYTEPLFLDHLTGGILYAMGRKEKSQKQF